MLLNNDMRGIYAYANMTIRPSKRYNPRPMPIPNLIVEKPKKPFRGLTNDMRGRDEGYAVCKSFKQKTQLSDLSKRLVNPIVRQEQYPQPKVRTKGIMISTLVKPISSRTRFIASHSIAKASSKSSEI